MRITNTRTGWVADGSHCTEPTGNSGRFCKPQTKFLVTLFSTILIAVGKVNFTNLSRYSTLNERTYRRQFEQEVEFARLNRGLVEQFIDPTHQLLAVMDCSFIAKSGKATCGRDWYWNGCANRSEQGLEVSLIGLVDVETQMGYALSAQQTVAQTELPDLTRMDQYLYHLDTVRCELPPSVNYLAVDGAYAKENFITGAVHLQLHVISKLRCDANRRWLYTGEQKPRGRRRKYDGKVKLVAQERLTFVERVRPDVDLYPAAVFHVSLKRTIRLAYLLNRSNPKKPRFVVLFSTDVEPDPTDIYKLYTLRFQIEFLFRDAKHFTGLADCQARDCLKLEFHFNASFTALNLAKVEALQQHQEATPLSFSMASVKRRALNEHLLDRFISNLDLSPSLIKSHPNYEKLRNYGTLAA